MKLDKEKIVLISITCLIILFVIYILVFLCISLHLDLALGSALNQAENTSGFCSSGQNLCVFSPNNSLGLPTDSSIFTFSTNTALILADLVGRLEYAAKNNTVMAIPPQFTLIQILYPTTGPVFTALLTTTQNSLTTLYIVFRGTETGSEWQTDLQTNQVGWSGSSTVLVHQGFFNMFNQFEPAIKQTIITTNASQMFIGGHSLGSAVATLCGMQFFNLAPLVTYAFASPRVGNIAFAQLVQSSFPIFRISNQSDLVNDIPLAVMPNLQGNQLPFIYDHTGTDYSFNINWGSWLNNHYLPVYINCLSNNPSPCVLTMVPFS